MNSVAAGPTASGSRVGRPAILDGRGFRPQRLGSRAGEGRAPSIGAREGVPSDWSSKTGKSRVASCLNTIGELISRMNEEDLSGLSGDELLADAEALAKLVSRLGAVRGRMLLAIDKKRSWRSSGTRTLTQWNEKASGQSPAAASREIKRAQALESELRKLSAALTDGEIFPEHVDAVRRVFSTPALKEKLTEDGVQDELISHAQKCAPREFERRIKARAFAHDAASGVEAEKKDASRESLAFAREGSGMRVTGWFSDETAAVVDTALSAIMGRKSAGAASPRLRRAGDRAARRRSPLHGRPHPAAHLGARALIDPCGRGKVPERHGRLFARRGQSAGGPGPRVRVPCVRRREIQRLESGRKRRRREPARRKRRARILHRNRTRARKAGPMPGFPRQPGAGTRQLARGDPGLPGRQGAQRA